MEFKPVLKWKLIYVFRINNDKSHTDCLKVGEASFDCDNITSIQPNSKILNKAAHERIKQYTQTAGVKYELLYTESAVYDNGHLQSFNDKDVHSVLLRSGIKKKTFDTAHKANEWFITDLETVKKAITAVKEGKESLVPGEISHDKSPIIFRPEQLEAIKKTEKQFNNSNQMLWNAKMRFGKTLSALKVVKDMEFNRSLILTHRPVVDSGWFEDFGKIFYDDERYLYGSKNNGSNFKSLEKEIADGHKYVYFASMQDLRGSELVGGNFDKNNEIFATKWDLIIVDEAHEGTQTELGKTVIAELIKPDTKVLRLSGTAFNLLNDFKEDEIYTWDYIMEQRAKANWDNLHYGDPNPYASLPTMNIYTYDLGRLLSDYIDEDVAFNFHEFFKVDKNGEFLHEKDVSAFLNLLTKEDNESLYPFANDKYRNIFRHTLWKVPGVKEAKALSALLKKHPVFQHFEIVNVAGNGDEEEESNNALEAVKAAIGDDPEQTRTITLSCGRLTTGVSVKEWTAVLMLSGSYNTAASGYMQTIFRVQTPATINGRVKEECYVFDFAPDRTLIVIAEIAKVSAKAGKATQDDRIIMTEFLNFCPIISIEGSKMKKYDVHHLLGQLKKAYIERVVNNGFEDRSLYNDELLKLNDLDLKQFDELGKIIGKTKAMPKTNSIDINNQGLTDEQYGQLNDLEKRNKKNSKKPLSDEEKKRLEELRQKQKNKENAISILRGISIRMPLLIYGAEIKDENKEITIDNFASLIDQQSWDEYMPRGVSKEKFNEIKKYYDQEIFSEAGKRIRAMARAADKLSIEERIERISNIFSTFRNPDKETVLTPWRVVNMHLGDCIGGYNFFDEKYETTISEPRFIDHDEVTTNIFTPEARILELNSKSGLYPLYMTYNIYRSRLASSLYSITNSKEQLKIWDSVLAENIFVVCKTPMAKSITKRTLVGFRNAKVNTRYFEDLINQIKNKPENFISKIKNGSSYWKAINDDNMKFNAIVGNPPYQVIDGGAGASATPVYNKFVDIAKLISPYYISLIMPARWYSGGKGLDSFRDTMIKDRHVEILHDYLNGKDCFNNVEIKGGVCYFLWDSKWNDKCTIFTHISNDEDVVSSKRFLKEEGDDIFIRDSKLVEIRDMVDKNNFVPFSDIISAMKPYGLRGDFFMDQKKYNLPAISNTKIKDGITIFGLDEKQQRVKKYIKANYPLPKKDGLDKYKIFIPRNYGSGRLEDNTFTTIVANPKEICTETFIQIYPFINITDAENCNKYLKTKFVRLLIGVRKQDQGAGRNVYKYVPLQDFTKKSDIDWSKSVAEIDKQLYAKYQLTDDEISYIEKMIKPME
jgi:hypothetical protein